jgi:hypothetical protein
MKIALSHLAPYFPYGLKVKLPIVNKKECRQYVIGTIGAIYSDGSICCHDTVNSTPNWFKPILKPIEDADSLIRLEWAKFHSSKDYDYDKEVIDLFSYEKIGTTDLLQAINLMHLPYDSMQWLLARHYDVFGLLDKGLAVSH